MNLENKKIVEDNGARTDGISRSRIREEILYKSERPSLVYDEKDIFGLVNFLSDGMEEEKAKEKLLEFIAELCEQYETDEWGGDGVNLYTLLLQLDWEFGARKKRKADISFRKKEKKRRLRNGEREILLRDFKMWQNGNKTKSAYAFYEEVGPYNKYGMCRTKIMNYLSPRYKDEKLTIAEETDCPYSLSNLKKVDLLMLEKFTAYVCFSSLNLCLAKALWQYITMLRYGKISKHKSDRKHYTLFQDGYSELEYAEELRKLVEGNR